MKKKPQKHAQPGKKPASRVVRVSDEAGLQRFLQGGGARIASGYSLPAPPIDPEPTEVIDAVQRENYRKIEAAHARNLTDWRNRVQTTMFPEVRWLYAVPNGGLRDPAIAGQLKAEGVLTGVWDYCLPVVRIIDTPDAARGSFWRRTCPGLYIELKAPGRERKKNGGLSDNQVLFGDFVRAQGYQTNVCYHWDDARAVIEAYLALPVKAFACWMGNYMDMGPKQ